MNRKESVEISPEYAVLSNSAGWVHADVTAARTVLFTLSYQLAFALVHRKDLGWFSGLP